MNPRRTAHATRAIVKHVAIWPFQRAQSSAFLRAVTRSALLNDDGVATALERLPERPLHELFPGIEDVEVHVHPRFGAWTLPYGETYALAAITAHLRPEQVFEIGTFTGQGTRILAENSSGSATVYTLDLPPDRLRLPGMESEPPEHQAARIGEAFKGTPAASKIKQLYGDSAQFDYSPFEGKVDLAFVDGVHTFEYVSGDSRAALRMLKPMGVVVWDDCSAELPGVVKALAELSHEIPIVRVSSTRLAVYRQDA